MLMTTWGHSERDDSDSVELTRVPVAVTVREVGMSGGFMIAASV